MKTTAVTSTPQRRTVSVLALAQALFMSVQGMGISATPLAAYTLLDADHKWLATVPIFLVHVGIMGTTIPASLLMAVIGRRAGFSLGALLGVVAGIIGCVALYERSFPLICLSTVLQGMQAAFFWYFRLAAADASEPALRAKAISLVMAGGVIAGFLGPQTAKWAVDWLAPVTFAGVYVAMAVFSVAVLVLVQFLHIPRLTPTERAAGGRPMREIARQPAYRVALAASVCGYAVMTLTMSATPLAMLACGFGFGDSATVIQAHIIAMFLPSFFTGHLIARVGVLPIIAAGGLIEFGCAIVNLAGIDFANFLIANVLVGLGWNFCFVGGSTLLTTTYALAERAKVQASHDFVVYAATATAAALSGVLQAKAGWTVINLAALPLMTAVVGAALWLAARQRRVAAAPEGPTMGDRYDRNQRKVRHPALRGLKPPPEIVGWGLTPAARIGHNQGPPLEEPVADAYVRWRWRKAYTEAWKTPSMSILKLRLARAEAAGVSYREYMLELLDTGRHLQAEDVARRRGRG